MKYFAIVLIILFLIFAVKLTIELIKIGRSIPYANCSTDSKTGRIVCSGYDSDYWWRNPPVPPQETKE